MNTPHIAEQAKSCEATLRGLVEKHTINGVLKALATLANAEADSIREHRMPSGNPSMFIDGDAQREVRVLEEAASLLSETLRAS